MSEPDEVRRVRGATWAVVLLETEGQPLDFDALAHWWWLAHVRAWKASRRDGRRRCVLRVRFVADVRTEEDQP